MSLSFAQRWLLCVLLLAAILSLSEGRLYVIYPDNSSQEYDSRPADFGSAFTSQGLQGKLIYPTPHNGCNAFEQKAPSSDPGYGLHWICLVDRGDCNFDEKVLHCQNAEYKAAVVVNTKGAKLEDMGGADKAGVVVIPSLMVSYATGDYLKESILYTIDANMTVRLTDEYSIPWNIYVIPFAVIVGLCLFVTIIFVIVKAVGHQRSIRRWRFPRANLRRIPTRRFKKGADDFDSCAICLDDYEDGEKLRILPCSHVYHTKCIDPWLTRGRRQCPICKRRIRNDGTCDMGVEQTADQGGEESPGERTPLVTTPNRQYRAQTLRRPLSETSREEGNAPSAAASDDASAAVVQSGPDCELKDVECGLMESSVACDKTETVGDDVKIEMGLDSSTGKDMLNTDEFVRVQDGHGSGISAAVESGDSTSTCL